MTTMRNTLAPGMNEGGDGTPDRQEQGWFVEQIGHLIGIGGEAMFLRPLVPEPDGSELNGEALLRLLRQLMDRAGLDDLAIRLEVTARPSVPGETRRTTGAFLGFVDETACFHLDLDTSEPGAEVPAIVCREVARAWRIRHEIDVETEETEDALIDVTTQYLGFGLITTNASYRYRSWGDGFDITRNTGVACWEHSSSGCLTPGEMSFLLALRAIAGRFTKRSVQRTGRALGRTQRLWFSRAMQLLEPRGDELRCELGTHIQRMERDDVPCDPKAHPGPSFADTVEWHADDVPNSMLADSGVVFRVKRTAATRLARWAMASCLPVGILVGVVTSVFLVGLGAGVAWFVGWRVFGPRASRDHCSNTCCLHPLTAEEVTCPGCGNEVVGAIDRMRDRLDAEDEWEQQQNCGPDQNRSTITAMSDLTKSRISTSSSFNVA